MSCFTVRPDFTKSSVFSLISITIVINRNKKIEKKNVVRKFLSIYQSSFFMLVTRCKDKDVAVRWFVTHLQKSEPPVGTFFHFCNDC